MKKLALALWSLVLLSAAQAQQVSFPPPAGTMGILCVYNASPPTLTTGNPGFVQCDSTGKLIVSGGGGGGGGAVTIADGADVAQGTTTDFACATDNGTCTLIALVKRNNQRITTAIAGTAITAAALPLPSGAATEATLQSINTNIQASIPAGTNRIGYQSDDPCTNKTKVNLPINQNGTSSVELKALSGSTIIYVCSLFLLTNSTATTVALTTGTGTACATGNAAVIGSTTANIANSMNLLAGAGFTLGGGHGTVARGAAAGALCMILGANVFVSGNLTYVQE